MGLKADGFIRLTLPDPPILTLLWLPYLLLSPKTDNYRFDRKSVGERIFHGHIRTQRPRKVLNRSLKHQCHVPVAKKAAFSENRQFSVTSGRWSRSIPPTCDDLEFFLSPTKEATFTALLGSELTPPPFGSYEKNLYVQTQKFWQIRRFDQFSKFCPIY